MAEYKNCRVMVQLEPSLRSLLSVIERDTDSSASTVLRALLLNELIARGLYSSDVALRMNSLGTRKSEVSARLG